MRSTDRVDSQSERPTIHAGGRKPSGSRRRLAVTRWSVDGDPVAISTKRQTDRLAELRQPVGGTRLTTGLECAIDTGVRCALRASGDAHRIARSSDDAPSVLRQRCRVRRGTPAVLAVAVATPLAEGSVRVRGEVEIHTSPLPSWGRYRTINPCGKAIRTPPWNAADQRIGGGQNPGRKSSKVIQDCTICVPCRCTGPCWTVARKRENRVGMAGLPKRSDCPLWGGSPGWFEASFDQLVLQCVHPSRPLDRLESRTSPCRTLAELWSPWVDYGRINRRPPPASNLVSGHSYPLLITVVRRAWVVGMAQYALESSSPTAIPSRKSP